MVRFKISTTILDEFERDEFFDFDKSMYGIPDTIGQIESSSALVTQLKGLLENAMDREKHLADFIQKLCAEHLVVLSKKFENLKGADMVIREDAERLRMRNEELETRLLDSQSKLWTLKLMYNDYDKIIQKMSVQKEEKTYIHKENKNELIGAIDDFLSTHGVPRKRGKSVKSKSILASQKSLKSRKSTLRKKPSVRFQRTISKSGGSVSEMTSQFGQQPRSSILRRSSSKGNKVSLRKSRSEAVRLAEMESQADFTPSQRNAMLQNNLASTIQNQMSASQHHESRAQRSQSHVGSTFGDQARAEAAQANFAGDPRSAGIQPSTPGRRSEGLGPMTPGRQSQGLSPMTHGMQSEGIQPSMPGMRSEGVQPTDPGMRSEGLGPMTPAMQSQGIQPTSPGGRSQSQNMFGGSGQNDGMQFDSFAERREGGVGDGTPGGFSGGRQASSPGGSRTPGVRGSTSGGQPAGILRTSGGQQTSGDRTPSNIHFQNDPQSPHLPHFSSRSPSARSFGGNSRNSQIRMSRSHTASGHNVARRSQHDDRITEHEYEDDDHPYNEELDDLYEEYSEEGEEDEESDSSDIEAHTIFDEAHDYIEELKRKLEMSNEQNTEYERTVESLRKEIAGLQKINDRIEAQLYKYQYDNNRVTDVLMNDAYPTKEELEQEETAVPDMSDQEKHLYTLLKRISELRAGHSDTSEKIKVYEKDIEELMEKVKHLQKIEEIKNKIDSELQTEKQRV